MTGAPLCLNCGRKLRRTRWQPRSFGGYGDGHFCGLNCGYRWAVMWLRRDPGHAARLHDAMVNVMAKAKGVSP